MRSNSETRFVKELILYAASAALSCLALFTGLRMLDPNREASKRALEHKKEISKRLGRPLIQTNSYEDVIACDVINPNHIDVEFDSIPSRKHCMNWSFCLYVGLSCFLMGSFLVLRKESCYIMNLQSDSQDP